MGRSGPAVNHDTGGGPGPAGSRRGGGWGWVEAAANLLRRDECEAVLGDLMEAGEGARQSLLAVLGLVVRREVEVWKGWRPWLAAFGLTVPCSFLLMGASMSASRAILQIFASGNGQFEHTPGWPWLSLGWPWLAATSSALLLLGWSWAGGFVAGSLSRRTLWVSAVCCFIPCLFCLSRFQVQSLSPVCLFLFLLPAAWGAREGLRIGQLRSAAAVLLAVAVSLLTIPTLHIQGEPWWNPPRWLIAVTLTWPAWYLAAASYRGPEHETCA